MWISSDEINVTAEADVFNIILAWIDHDKSKRKEFFPELFRQVRLVYRLTSVLRSYIATNDLVNDNEDCLNLVEEAIRLIESKNYDNLHVTPRKWLEITVIVACSPLKGHQIQCYSLCEDQWCSLGKMPFSFVDSNFTPCHSKIYGKQTASRCHRCQIVSYNLYTNNWMSLPCKEDRDLKQIFVANEDEMYALVSEPC
ncbi:hypothetical protein ACROYT_G038612 [Oculina patagonica]